MGWHHRRNGSVIISLRIRQRRPEAKKKRGRKKKTSFSEIVNYGIGELGISPKEFWHEWTFADYQRRAYYHNKNEETRYKTQWETARYIAFTDYAINGGKRSIEHAMPLSWDQKERIRKVKPLTSEKKREIESAYARFFAKKLEHAASRN